MSTYNKHAEIQEDRTWQEYNASKWERLIYRLFRGQVQRFVSRLTMAAYERGDINSEAMHELTAMADRRLRPDIYL